MFLRGKPSYCRCTGNPGADMPELETVTLDLELEPGQALALAQFTKRVGWLEMRACAVDDKESYEIRAALGVLAKALAGAGYAPR